MVLITPWYFKIALFEALFFIGFFLTHPEEDPDTLFSNSRMIGLILYSSSFFLSIYSWGDLISNFIKSNFLKINFHLKLFLGTLIFILSGFILGISGKIYIEYFSFILHLGPALNAYIGFKNKQNIFNFKKIDSITNLQYVFWSVPILIIIVNILSALVPSHFWDPLWYHLTAPQIWFEARKIYLPTFSPILFQTGPWEILYLWATVLCKGESGHGMISVLIFSQLIHCILGFAGSALAVRSIFKSKITPNYLPLVVLSVIGVKNFSFLQDFSSVAKNDWGLIFFALTGLYIILEFCNSKNKNLLIPAGFIIGITFTLKFTSIYFILSVIIFLIAYELRKNKSKVNIQIVLYILIGIVLGLIPFTLRNYYFTSNPLYPIFNNLFDPAMLPLKWNEVLPRYQGSGFEFNPIYFPYRLFDIFLMNPLSIFIFIIFAGKRFFNLEAEKYKLFFYLIVSLLIGVALFSIKSGDGAETRLMGPILPLIIALSITCISFYKLKNERYKIIIYILFVFLIINSVHHFKGRYPLFLKQNASKTFLTYPGAPSLAWFRRNSTSDDMLISLQEIRLYPVSHLKYSRVWDDPRLEKIFLDRDNDREFVNSILMYGGTHLLHTEEALDIYYKKEDVMKILELVGVYPKSIVFQSSLSKVIDLRILYSEIQAHDEKI